MIWPYDTGENFNARDELTSERKKEKKADDELENPVNMCCRLIP